MKSTQVDQDGNVRCPKCGAANQFMTKRTGKGKVMGGALLAPKRLKCNGCGTNLKRGGDAWAPEVKAEKEAKRAATPEPVKVPAWLEKLGSGKPSQQEMLYARMDREEAAKAAGVAPTPPAKKHPDWDAANVDITKNPMLAPTVGEALAIRKARKVAKEQAKVDAKTAEQELKQEAQAAKVRDALSAKAQSDRGSASGMAAALGVPESWVHYDEQAERWARWDGERWGWA